jgi:hypothetical protein
MDKNEKELNYNDSSKLLRLFHLDEATEFYGGLQHLNEDLLSITSSKIQEDDAKSEFKLIKENTVDETSSIEDKDYVNVQDQDFTFTGRLELPKTKVTQVEKVLIEPILTSMVLKRKSSASDYLFMKVGLLDVEDTRNS